MITGTLTLSAISLILLIIITNFNIYTIKMFSKLKNLWFFDFIPVILILGIIPVLNIVLFSYFIMYAITYLVVKRLTKLKGSK